MQTKIFFTRLSHFKDIPLRRTGVGLDPVTASVAAEAAIVEAVVAVARPPMIRVRHARVRRATATTVTTGPAAVVVEMETQIETIATVTTGTAAGPTATGTVTIVIAAIGTGTIEAIDTQQRRRPIRRAGAIDAVGAEAPYVPTITYL